MSCNYEVYTKHIQNHGIISLSLHCILGWFTWETVLDWGIVKKFGLLKLCLLDSSQGIGRTLQMMESVVLSEIPNFLH